MTSPICLVNGFATTNGVDVSPGSIVTIQLADTAGVITWEIECIGTDDLLTTDEINDTLTIIDITAKTATFTMPNDDGYAVILRSRVNRGVDVNGRTVPDYTTTFKIATLINSNRTIAANETTESSSTFGWAKPVNEIIRFALTSHFDLGGDLSGTLPDPTVEKIRGVQIGSGAGSLTAGHFLKATGTSTADWSPVVLTGDVLGTNDANTCTLAGDVNGRTGTNTVDKVKGTNITTSGGGLSTGAVLRVTAASTADWGQVDLANSNAITGVLPTANRPAPIFAAVGVGLSDPIGTIPFKIDLIDGYTNLSNGITISTVNDTLTVSTSGYYRIYVGLTCYTSSGSNDEIKFSFYKNGSIFTSGTSQYNPFLSYLPAGSILFPLSFECVASLSANDVIDVRVINTSLDSPEKRSVFNGIFGMTLL